MLLRRLCALLAAACLLPGFSLRAATVPRKPHVVTLGSVKQVVYSKAGDPANAGPDETSLKTRALLVDTRVIEWTTGDAHDVTDRSFVVRRALRINDSLPGDKPTHWVWQRGPWLLIDRVTGRVTALKLPDYDPAASQVAWFRDYAAYCGVTPTGKSLFAMVAQVAAPLRKPVLAKKLSAYDRDEHVWPACGLPEWQREPLRVTFHTNREGGAGEAVSFDVISGSAMLVEEGNEEPEVAKP